MHTHQNVTTESKADFQFVVTSTRIDPCFNTKTSNHLFLTSFCFVFQEIYPPKIFEFAYVTDGACDTWDIQRTELHILKVKHRHTLLMCSVLYVLVTRVHIHNAALSRFQKPPQLVTLQTKHVD